MTEGQLYTVVLTALAVALLSLTGLPHARQPSRADPAPVVPRSVAAAAAVPRQAPDDPTTPILAIVSPIAAPACAAAGAGTLLIPILGGLVADNLGVGDSVDVADLVLDVLGPLYVVCGTLPESPGSRCALDANLAGIWPADVSGFGLSAPVVAGNVVDALGALLDILGLPPVTAVTQALACDVADAELAPEAAPPADPAPLTAPVGSEGAGPGSPPAATSLARPPAAGETRPPIGGAARAPARSITSVVDDTVPGGLLALQLAVAAALLLCLSGSWFTSWRLGRRSEPR
jgi:hypothetical protein